MKTIEKLVTVKSAVKAHSVINPAIEKVLSDLQDLNEACERWRGVMNRTTDLNNHKTPMVWVNPLTSTLCKTYLGNTCAECPINESTGGAGCFPNQLTVLQVEEFKRPWRGDTLEQMKRIDKDLRYVRNLEYKRLTSLFRDNVPNNLAQYIEAKDLEKIESAQSLCNEPRIIATVEAEEGFKQGQQFVLCYVTPEGADNLWGMSCRVKGGDLEVYSQDVDTWGYYEDNFGGSLLSFVSITY